MPTRRLDRNGRLEDHYSVWENLRVSGQIAWGLIQGLGVFLGWVALQVLLLIVVFYAIALVASAVL